MKSTGAFSLLFAALLTLSSAGCAFVREYPRLGPAPKAVLVSQDLPIPEGFVLDRHGSWRHERSSFRKLKLVFRRGEYLNELRVAEFVEEAFPQKGWHLDFKYGFDNVKFVFTKGSEECLVTVEDEFATRHTELTMEVKPRETPDGGLVARSPWEDAEEEPAQSEETTSGGGSSK